MKKLGTIEKCINCGKEFYCKRFRKLKSKNGVYCSKLCANRTISKNRIGIKRDPLITEKMALKIRGRKYTEAHKQALRDAHPRLKGELSPHWKGGKKDENERLRNSLEYHIWRKEVYKKDNWKCRICNKHCHSKEIVAHHIKLFSDFPELRFSVDNGITLCRSCHLKVHQSLKNKYD